MKLRLLAALLAALGAGALGGWCWVQGFVPGPAMIVGAVLLICAVALAVTHKGAGVVREVTDAGATIAIACVALGLVTWFALLLHTLIGYRTRFGDELHLELMLSIIAPGALYFVWWSLRLHRRP